MNNSHKVILNTAVLYGSLLIRIAVGLITARLVLSSLGETNYGVYMVVAGIIATLDVLTTSMSGSSMRFMANSLGSGDKETILKTFNTTVYIHYLMAIIIVAILEIGGFLMFKYVVNIPPDSVFDAKIVFQFMVATVAINMIAVPYDAVANAYERIYVLSLFGVLGVLLSLAGAITLCYYNGDRLIFYGLYQLFIAIILRLLKVHYAKKNFSECRHVQKKYYDKSYFKSIFSYNGWNLLGTFSGIGLTQMRKLIINRFFGVRLNASEGVSYQVNSYLNNVSVSMTRAIDPQIMKSEGAGDTKRMVYITEISSKYSAFLFALVGIPFLLEASAIYHVWLKEVPEYAVLFSQLLIIYQILEKFSFQITRAIRAVGTIKAFTIAEAIVSWSYVPFIILLYKRGYPAETIYYLTIVTSLLAAGVRFYYGRKIAGINIAHFIKGSIITVITPLLLAGTVTWLIIGLLPETIWRVIITVLVFCSLFVLLFWVWGLSSLEKIQWKSMLNNIIKKISDRKR